MTLNCLRSINFLTMTNDSQLQYGCAKHFRLMDGASLLIAGATRHGNLHYKIHTEFSIKRRNPITENTITSTIVFEHDAGSKIAKLLIDAYYVTRKMALFERQYVHKEYGGFMIQKLKMEGDFYKIELYSRKAGIISDDTCVTLNVSSAEASMIGYAMREIEFEYQIEKIKKAASKIS